MLAEILWRSILSRCPPQPTAPRRAFSSTGSDAVALSLFRITYDVLRITYYVFG
jgi:hypothetical protein